LNPQTNNVVIIGGGLSGILSAIYMSNLNNGPKVILLEKDPEKLGRGIAYQQEFTSQPLNVIADSMSIFEDKPEHFVNWIKLNSFRYSHLVKEINGKSFIPRKIFGDYLVESLKEAHDLHGNKFQILIDEAVSISKSERLFDVGLSSGLKLKAENVILALGNFPPADIPCVTKEIKKSSAYFSNSWTDKIYKGLTGNEDILLIGSGLTAVDVVLGLHIRRFNGNIVMISRKGKLPLQHFISNEKFNWNEPYLLSPLDLLKSIRKNIRNSPHLHWSLIIDSLRSFVPKIWSFWTEGEKLIFLKRLRPFWEIARHRIPSESLKILRKLERLGKLIVLKTEVSEINLFDDGLKAIYKKGDIIEERFFRKIINCTGPESNYRKIKFPIISNLMANNLVIPDNLGLGILCDPEGRIINENNQIVNGLWCIGPMRKAILWETTALREIRAQAKELSEKMNKNKIERINA
jgi:uncharacterized NAD(P)/FAD-binding protein YdhS